MVLQNAEYWILKMIKIHLLFFHKDACRANSLQRLCTVVVFVERYDRGMLDLTCLIHTFVTIWYYLNSDSLSICCKNFVHQKCPRKPKSDVQKISTLDDRFWLWFHIDLESKLFLRRNKNCEFLQIYLSSAELPSKFFWSSVKAELAELRTILRNFILLYHIAYMI